MARHFPHWIKAYVEHARHTEAPTIFHVWSAVSAVAGALRRQVWIDEIEYKYFPNFYIILVGPAAITKGTAMNRAMGMLRQVEGVHFGPESATWQKFIQKMAETAQDISVVLPGGDTKGFTSCPITIAAEELGTFFKIEDDVMMDVLTRLWQSPSGEWSHATLSMGDNTVQSPCINFIGCTTPTWLKKHFPEDLIGAGLTSRIIFVYGEEKANIIAFPSRHILPREHRDVEKKLVADLQKISTLKGQYILTEEAFRWGEEWYGRHNTERATSLASDRYNGYVGRKQTHILKLSIILAAAKRDKLIIEVEDMQEALALVEHAEPMMMKVFESIGMVDEARRNSSLLQLVRIHGTLTSNQLWGQVSNIMRKKEFLEAMSNLVKEGHFKVVILKGGEKAVTLSDAAKQQIAQEKSR